ncbi:MAG: hypothetical protein KAH32_06715, partial [Chlamydiia bacterium]|nr:hypothetical protein [Chlamydiia bacterium]
GFIGRRDRLSEDRFDDAQMFTEAINIKSEADDSKYRKQLEIEEKKKSQNVKTEEEIENETYGVELSNQNDSDLYQMYSKIGGTNYGKAIGFLGNMAEAESGKGRMTSNKASSASGIFHYLVGNGGGFNKAGGRVAKGQYNESGKIARSSFQTAQQRVKNVLGSEAFGHKFRGKLKEKMIKISEAEDPNDLSNEEQAMLTLTSLKMKSGRFDQFIAGNVSDMDLYARDWVTLSGDHSLRGIKTNWKNALKRGVIGKRGSIKSHYKFFGA